MNAFAAILRRVEEKRDDYATYGFDRVEMAALNTFFDLAQEYDYLENIYTVTVTVPRVFFGLQCNLYMIDPKTETIKCVANSHPDTDHTQDTVPNHIRIADVSYQHGHTYVVPIHGKKTPSSSILLHGTRDIMGIFEATRTDRLTEAELFFIQKYVNRVGYNLYNKSLAEQNIRHLKFINNLVADIEHNVIVPNLRYKSYFTKIRKYLNTNKEIERDLDAIVDEVKAQDRNLYAKISEIVERMVVINRSIFDHQQKIEKHYKHTSLFLETLLRPDHFLFGEYILRKTPSHLWKDIIVPQLERYRDRFVQQGIGVDPIIDKKRSEEIEVRVDKGLIAQVVANLLSNAEKYAESVVDASGKKVKKVDCTTSVMEDFFGQGHHGARFDVFSSGSSINKEDVARIFEEGFRLTQSESVEGKGHGLYFVKNVIEVHGGIVGHKAGHLGNEFYFVIPV